MTKIRTFWQDLLSVRQKMNLSQRHFAAHFGFPVATLRHWERGNRRPTGTALVLLFVIRSHPRAVRQAVKNARLFFPGCLPPLELPSLYRAPPGWGARRERSLARKAVLERKLAQKLERLSRPTPEERYVTEARPASKDSTDGKDSTDT